MACLDESILIHNSWSAGDQTMQSNDFYENKKLLMQVGMANHNLGEKSEKISTFPRKKLQCLKMLTLLLSVALIFKSEKKKDRKNKNLFQKWRSLLLLKVKCLFLTIVSHTLRIIITVQTPLMATSLQWPLFWRHSPYIDSCLNFSTEATSLQRLLSSVHKVAVVERFNITVFQCTLRFFDLGVVFSPIDAACISM